MLIFHAFAHMELTPFALIQLATCEQPLRDAAKDGYEDVVKAYLAKGVNVNANDKVHTRTRTHAHTHTLTHAHARARARARALSLIRSCTRAVWSNGVDPRSSEWAL